MKKRICFISLVSFFLLLAACSNKKELVEEERRKVSSNFDMKLVEQVVGDWRPDADASYPAQRKSTIVLEDGYLIFDDNQLEIVETIEHTLLTQTNEEKPFYYDFSINENKMSVYPSYPVPKGSVGGSLMPMEFIRDDKSAVQLSDLYGKWESIEESETYYISISETIEGSVKYADNLENKNSEELNIEEIRKDSISFLTKDKELRYYFSFQDDNHIEAFKEVNASYYAEKKEEIPVGMSKPIKYEKLSE